jgi:hypothetical protein
VLELIDAGVSRKEVATKLGVSVGGVALIISRRRPTDLTSRREERHADHLLHALPFDERHEYELEGVTRIMIGGLSIADEDYDPTPVPEGCPSCWRGPGALDQSPCQRCPDPEAKARCRLERRGGLVSRT